MKKANQPAGVVLIKYGGNAMLDDAMTRELLNEVSELTKKGHHVVLVHGGGPFIEENLKLAGINTEFVEGHRKTTGEAMKYIEMALKGHVNSKLVRMLNELGMKAVGLSGKDGRMVQVEKRYHTDQAGTKVDIGYVGNIKQIDASLLDILLGNDFIPVVSTISSGEDGADYNVNADMFAGSLAGALKAKHFIMLTDVDGLLKDPSEPASLIREIKISEMDNLYEEEVIKGGMIPKTEACKTAIENGAESALIINGKKPERLMESIKETKNIQGTRFVKSNQSDKFYG
ncbi:MAG: acetylglutamate kinase [Bacteroidales bacterium]|nr:acetylglutamate kinase [Bacteroidales bacterium]